VTRTAYLAAEGYDAPLREELGAPEAEYGRLLVYAGDARPSAWAQNIWHDVQELPVPSIGQAAKSLRALQRNWALHDYAHHRRAALIVENLPKVSAKKLIFGTPKPAAPLGAFALIAPDRMLAAQRCSSPFPDGECHFIEDKSGPPNRAYLKLWESLTLNGAMPGPGQTCIDLGASPGGWTWVLAKLGADVLAIDKASLDPEIAKMKGVSYKKDSAFALDPASVGPVDWLFSDVICYPARLFDLVEKWRAAGMAKNIICTLKFQGPTDHETAKRFAAIPNSRLLHLFHNKHELTWFWSAVPASKTD
jgi:23S rRNA (cytidine2498-2'-O)-methyltransferase